ncbi:uncharacterized protein B0H18DRAFT_988990 [Fomitopsis serialis]|uniref:uncharacterized protein n=1 Tax=Fomitopsis serialis TaxID=139415 RepID=UPI00200778C2|nr:uncharacterized protein B0H18DRAFT_988990 [Neoantrodia serialis]KAH9931976.1 hypothetical protein B0H18DRAFT_988990 [Neoantrodia serialis]
MVFVGEKKYACESCIKGHRSSTCQHIDRPLYEIKKKGRPATQCEHCRELRKTKQVHVKCMCASKDSLNDSVVHNPASGPSTVREGNSKISASAAFPSGLPPEVLGASVALHSAISDGSDSENSHVSPALSECDHSGKCDCATTRGLRHKGKAPVRPRRGSTAQVTSPHGSREPPIAGPAGIVASAHGPGHRPVLPRPPPPEREASLHPSAIATSHVSRSRRQSHGQPYSPYEMAYEQARGGDEYDSRRANTVLPDSGSATSLQDFQSWTNSLATSSTSAFFSANDSLCGCGPTCACPGCIEHRGPDVLLGAPCTDPNTCIACLEYGMLGMPVPSPPDVPAYEAAQAQNVDEWLRQMADTEPPMQPQSSIPAQLSSSFTQSSVPPSRTQNNSRTSPQQVPSPSGAAGLPGSHEADMPYDPALLRTYALWNDLRDARTRSRPAQGEWDEQDELGHTQQVTDADSYSGRCQCPAGMCACPVECCRGGRITFALSAERNASCCRPSSTSSSSPPALRQNPRQTVGTNVQQPEPITEAWAMQGTSGTAGEGGVVDWGALDVPRVTLSRASSHWSQSSAGHSPSSSSSLGSALVVPSPPGWKVELGSSIRGG